MSAQHSVDMPSHIIFGGAGFLGRHVGRAYVDLGETVCSVDLTQSDTLIAPDVHGVSGDLFNMDRAALRELIEPFDTIHHLVWSTVPASAEASAEEDLNRNVGFTVRLIEVLKGSRKRLLFSSSGGTVYGRNDDQTIDERQPCRPVSAYGAGKVAAEAYILAASDTYDLDVRIARLSNPFGAGQSPAQPQGAASRFIRNALSGQPIDIWGDGEVVRDFVHIEDVVAGWVSLEGATRAALVGDRLFNIGSGCGTNLNELVATISQVIGHKPVVRYTENRAFDLPRNVLDISLAEDRLGWRPELSLLDGVRATVADLASDKDALFAQRRPSPGKFDALLNRSLPLKEHKRHIL